ncbi:ThiF family adenylyltransferase [Vibrio sp. CAIM 722]|uniref:ThiF family adenylyltransferase n=1 Tax=Vibrio eleionomae TaxID=2653505 RepID=A0A7X4LQ33_9VIBR|nr:ThiF family adenylyltransferase [Vibrio eleionomae]MZI96108.1 ThiF family adenylyltransferase [Vibrio eleionomae]
MDSQEYYKLAVTRNIGLVTEEEQTRLKHSRVAVAGCGGLGGRELIDLVRMGIGRFNLADFDEFSIKNVNRQIGATSSTADRPKVEVMTEMAKDIHPSVDIKMFPNGIQEDNVVDFVSNADVIVDAIDFFSMPARRLLHKTARKCGKPVVFAAPLGFSGTMSVFVPNGLSFDEYFDINDDMDLFEQLIAFTVGVAPWGTHWKYMDTSKVDSSDHSGPSLACACNIATGLLTSEVLIILLNKRAPMAVPNYMQFDTMRCLYRKGKLHWGNRGPLQRLKRLLAAKKFADQREVLLNNKPC